MQPPHRILTDSGSRLTAPLEDVSRAVQWSLFPMMDNRMMHATFGGQL
jgi:hypothetical protein